MKKIALIIFSLCLTLNITAQKHDNIWVQGGYEGNVPNQPNFGLTLMNFSSGTMKLESPTKGSLWLEETCASICDKTGKLAFYCNGLLIENGSFDTIPNSKLTSPFWTLALTIPQGTMILPFPEKDSLYMVFYEEPKFVTDPKILSTLSTWLHYCVVDMSANNGKGKIVSKDSSINKPENPSWGKISAIKHSNGKDWWIYFMSAWDNEFFRYELTKDGLKYKDSQIIGLAEQDGVGTSEFSPDGTKYARYNSVGTTLGQYISLYDFDRCTGKFSNPKNLKIENRSGCGVVFSPNSRYLYVGTGEEIRQYDTWVKDLAKAQKIVAKYDGFGTCNGGVGAGYYNGQLAPDGKIYYCTQACSNVLHVIEKPNLGDILCEVKSHSIVTPTWYYASMPKFPNFRLGKAAQPCTVGVEDASEPYKVSIYPNPAEDLFHIHSERGAFSISITDIQGRIVYNGTAQNDITIDTNNWQSGIYQVLITDKTSGQKSIEKVVIMR